MTSGTSGGLTSIFVDSASLISLSKSSFFHARSTTAGKGADGTGFVLVGCAVLLILGDTRFGDIPLPAALDKGEFLTDDFLPWPGDERTLFLFLIANGSTGLGIPLTCGAGFGVASVLPVGSNGCRLLRGIELAEFLRVGVTVRFVISVIAESSADSRSVDGNARSGVMVGVFGGRGDGLRGPSGRPDEWSEVDRLCRPSEVIEVALLCGLEGGDGGRCVLEELVDREAFDRWLCVRFADALEEDRKEAGGSSN